MRYTIDRLSGEIVVCEDENGDPVKLMASELPKGAREGDILLKQGDVWCIDVEGSKERRQAMGDKLKRLIE